MRGVRFYVNGTTGSDTLDAGRGESADKPFKTIQAAVNYVTDNYNVSRYVLTIYCANVSTSNQLILPEYQCTTGYMRILKDPSLGDDVPYGLSIDYHPTGASFAIDISGGEWRLNGVKASCNNNNGKTGGGHIGVIRVTNQAAKLYLYNTKIEMHITKSGITYAGCQSIAAEQGTIYINYGVEITGNQEVSTPGINALYAFSRATLRYDDGSTNLKITGSFYSILTAAGAFFRNGVYRDIIDTSGIVSTTYKYRIISGGQCDTIGGGPDYFGTNGEGYVEESTYSWYK